MQNVQLETEFQHYSSIFTAAPSRGCGSIHRALLIIVILHSLQATSADSICVAYHTSSVSSCNHVMAHMM